MFGRTTSISLVVKNVCSNSLTGNSHLSFLRKDKVEAQTICCFGAKLLPRLNRTILEICISGNKISMQLSGHDFVASYPERDLLYPIQNNILLHLIWKEISLHICGGENCCSLSVTRLLQILRIGKIPESRAVIF